MRRLPLLMIGLAFGLLTAACSGSGGRDQSRPAGGSDTPGPTPPASRPTPAPPASTPTPEPTPVPSPSPVPTSKPVPPAAPKPPSTNERAFRLVAGDGGGFTGQWSGFVLESDGRVATWQGRDADSAPRTPVGTATPEERRRLWDAVREAGFFEREVNEPGNLSRSVRIEAGSETRTWTWSVAPGSDRSDRATVWNACQDLLRRVQTRED